MFNLLRQVVCCVKKAHEEEQVGLEEGIIEDGPITSQPGSENPVRLQEMVSLLEHLGDMPKDFSLVQAYKDLQVKYERLPEIMESPVQGQVMAKFNVKNFEYLTKGNFGKVFRIRTEDERTFVLKVQIPKYGVASRLWDYWNLCRDEINMLRMLKHKNVMALEGYGSFTCAELFNLPVYTVMQCEDLEMSLEDLFQKVERFQHASQFTTAFNDLGSGLAYLHQKGIAHHDLKPQNIMVSNQPGQTKLYEMAKEDLQQQLQNFVFKIIDLGIAKNYSSQIQNERLVDVSEKQCRGTTMWMCPQKIAMEAYNPFLSDVHALGLILLVSSVGVYDIHVVSQGNVIERNVRAKYGAELSTLNPSQQKVLFRMTETVEFARPLLSEIVPLRKD